MYTQTVKLRPLDVYFCCFQIHAHILFKCFASNTLITWQHFLAYSRKLGNRRSSEGLRSFKPSRGTNLLVLIILAGDIEKNPRPRSQCRQCKKYCKATDKVVKCHEGSKRFHVSSADLSEKE